MRLEPLRPGAWTARVAVLVLLLGVAPLFAQQGDRADEDRGDLPQGLVVPPAVVRSPTEELATFALQPGFRIELVASEPLLADPVQAVFDADGRLWVVEMHSYMRDVDATDERRKDGQIAVLRDRDGDGRMDERMVFLDGLALPRGVLPLPGGALVIAPPELWWVRDRDGDLVPEGHDVVCAGFDSGLANPEHSGNGLLWALDNGIHLADDARVLRWDPTRSPPFRIEPTVLAGQWGIAQDDRGRLYYDYNEDWLRVDLVPRHHGAAAKPAAMLAGCNVRLLADPRVFPAHLTPGVNRGGRPGMLKDGVLQRHTAVCAPFVLRDANRPEVDGDVFVCEPAGNLVRRLRLEDLDGRMRAANAYDGAEFLASTDERFRPVNLTQGPDGALYVVDFYRGVVQHKNFVTTFLRKQIEARSLERPIGLGRVFRVVADGPAAAPASPMSTRTTDELVDALRSPLGFVRDRAQMLLVMRDDLRSVEPLRALVREAKSPFALHALAVLDGIGELRCDELRRSLAVGDAALRCFALGLSGAELSRGDRVLLERVEGLALAAEPCVRWHAAIALGEVEGPMRSRTTQAAARLLVAAGDDAILRDAILRGLAGREPAAVRSLFAEPFGEALAVAVKALSTQCGRARDASAHEDLLQAVAACTDPRLQVAVLEGLCAAVPKEPDEARGFYVFAVTPPSLAAIVRTGRSDTGSLAQRLLAAIELRASTVAAGVVPANELSPPERELVAAGQRVYGAYCAACHQSEGQGLDGLAPPIRGSAWVRGDADVLLKIVLHGVRGPIEAAGARFDGDMPSQAHLGDRDLAAAVSFVRHTFGNGASTVGDEEVARMRRAFADRRGPWTAAELQPAK